MLIGIISDTHDDMGAIARAVDLFNGREVSLVIHAGDIVSPFTFEVLDGLSAEFTAIFGNNDGDRILLRERSKNRVHVQPYLAELAGRKVVVVHEPHLVDPLADSGDFDLVVYGHTHRTELRRVGKTLVLNPGKAARLHRGRSTAALLDTEGMEAEHVELI